MTETNEKLHHLITTIKTLRGERGCPWDRKQTNKSLLKYISSESQELIDAIQNNDFENIYEEAGDLLYLIIMLSEINSELGYFTLDDIIESIDEKLIRRHPHVFKGTTYENEEQLEQQWAKIKLEEKRKKSI